MLIYDALDGRFLTIKLRPRQSCCSVCGDNPTINKLQDYEVFCGASATDKVIRRKKLIINVQPPLTSDHLSNFCKVTPRLLQQYVALQKNITPLWNHTFWFVLTVNANFSVKLSNVSYDTFVGGNWCWTIAFPNKKGSSAKALTYWFA